MNPDSPEPFWPIISPSRGEFVAVAVVGSVAGLLMALVSSLITLYLSVIFCNSQEAVICDSIADAGYYIALVLAMFLATIILINRGIYRPLLLTLLCLTVLWGLGSFTQGLWESNWWHYLTVIVIVTCIVHLVFYWLVRWRNLAASIGASIAVIIAAYWMILV